MCVKAGDAQAQANALVALSRHSPTLLRGAPLRATGMLNDAHPLLMETELRPAPEALQCSAPRGAQSR